MLELKIQRVSPKEGSEMRSLHVRMLIQFVAWVRNELENRLEAVFKRS